MAEKELNVRMQIKKDTEANWNLVGSTFIPLDGEICIYVMTAGGENRFKIGDGTTTVGSLPFNDAPIRALIDTLEGDIDSVSGTVDSLNSQISALSVTVSGVQLSLNSKADINSPIFTGSPASTTPSAGDNSTRIATTAFVQNALSGVGGGGVDIQLSSAQPQGQKAGDLWYKII